MRISVQVGDRSVHIKIKGKSAKLLTQAEQAAKRLLDTTPEPAGRQPFGFGATSDHDQTPDDSDDQGTPGTQRYLDRRDGHHA